jgi:hypothetical protein
MYGARGSRLTSPAPRRGHRIRDPAQFLGDLYSLVERARG